MALKKKLSIAMLIVLTILIGVFLIACGDENNKPQKVAIEISSFDDLLSMADKFDSIKDNEYFLLTTDIDCDEQSWAAVGSLNNPFSCEFDGNGYTISNLI